MLLQRCCNEAFEITDTFLLGSYPETQCTTIVQFHISPVENLVALEESEAIFTWVLNNLLNGSCFECFCISYVLFTTHFVFPIY